MSNAVSCLQQMMVDYPGRAKAFAITSGKGGVGKTTIAANLAVCLAASQKKTLLFDADTALGNVDVVMNVNSKYNISHFLSGRKNIEDIIHTGPEGLEIISGASGLEELSNLSRFQRQRLLKELSNLQQDADMMLIDTAAGITKSVIGFCLAADQVLVVTTPEPPAVTDAYAMIKVLVANNFTGPISLIVNKAATIAEGKKVHQHIKSVVRRFLNHHLYDAGILLNDERMVSAVRLRQPVVLSYPGSRITSSIVALASKLSNGPAAAVSEDGFLGKVVNWFF